MLQHLTGYYTVIGLLHSTHMLQEQATFRSRKGGSGVEKEVQEQKKKVQEHKHKFAILKRLL